MTIPNSDPNGEDPKVNNVTKQQIISRTLNDASKDAANSLKPKCLNWKQGILLIVWNVMVYNSYLYVKNSCSMATQRLH